MFGLALQCALSMQFVFLDGCNSVNNAICAVLLFSLSFVPALAITSEEFVKQGEAALVAKDIAGAMKAFDAALDADPRNAKAAYDRGRINLVLHKNAQAVADFTSAVLSDPTLGVAYSARGEAKIILKDEKGGFADLDAAIAASPKEPEVYILRATYLMRKGNASGAKADLIAAKSFANGDMAKMLDAMIARIE
jgi:tetratricopeptide (TPR) repeat protein